MATKLTPEEIAGRLAHIEWIDDYRERLLQSKINMLDELYQTGKFTKKGTLRKRFQK